MLHRTLRTEQIVEEAQLHPPPPVPLPFLLAAHCKEYVERVRLGQLSKHEVRRIGFPWSPALYERSIRVAGATIEACKEALSAGISVNLAGGTHHASYDRGQGYCVFNDSAVAVRALQAEHSIKRILILDCDVHQGNGTAEIFADEPDVFTFSIHNHKAFPLHKAVSDLDIDVPPKTQDTAYLALLTQGLEEVFARFSPECVIYLAGVDPYEDDRLGGLSLTKAGLAQRDHLVLRACRERGLPVAITMSGGYAHRIEDIVALHAQTIEIATGYI
tara:strand:+ start:25818 stop:26639 length:822 start_codon:yes stop_codon:yes gene_type:complete